MRFGLSIVFIWLFISCGGKEEENSASSPISEVPSINIEKIEPTEINQFESITFQISYTDGDGDIGEQDPDIHSLVILDTRDSIAHTFHIPPQSPTTGIVIKGVFVVEIENIILLDQSNSSENIVFEVSLEDREGNKSNIASSDIITVSK